MTSGDDLMDKTERFSFTDLITVHFNCSLAVWIDGVNTVSMTTRLVNVSTIARNYKVKKNNEELKFMAMANSQF